MESLLHLLHFLVKNRFVFLVLALVFFLAVRFFLVKHSASGSKKNMVSVLVALFMWAALSLFFFGAGFLNKKIYAFGERGHAKILDIRLTGDMYNHEPVMRYSLQLKTKKGETFKTHFESTDNNRYPDSGMIYPYLENGDSFPVKYLEGHPSCFVILTEEIDEIVK